MGRFQLVNEAEFEKLLLQAEIPVIVDFGAEWCGPCKRMKPAINSLAEKWNGKALFLEVDVDESQDLTMKYQIMSVPTLMVLIGGSIKGRLTGLQSEARIVDEFGPWIGD